MSFRTDAFEQEVARLRTSGVEVTEVSRPEDPVRAAVFRDCDGNPFFLWDDGSWDEGPSALDAVSVPVDVRRLTRQGYEEVVRLDLGPTVAFVAIHMTVDGRAFGGVRIVDYPSEEDALDDACALAGAMSRKLLLAGLRGGGAKTVVIRPKTDREIALRRLGAFIESLGGRYHCGGDLGFTADDEAALRMETGHVACGSIGNSTARTVRLAMDAACTPRSVAIQGLGAVGLPLAEGLRADGIEVIAADIRDVSGFDLVDPGSILDTGADVFAPCARGGVIDFRAARNLRCKVICGGANNPLATFGVAGTLHSAGIVYVPDFVANVGAAIEGVSRTLGEADLVEERLLRVASLTRELLEAAKAENCSPLRVALARANAAVARARGG